MKYAVVKAGGKQYRVSEGEELDVDRIDQKEGEEINLSEVLLLVDGDQVKIGQPTIEGFSLRAKILSHFKGEKIRVARFKAKSRYRKVTGFRAFLTKIQILPFGSKIEKLEKPASSKRTKTKKT